MAQGVTEWFVEYDNGVNHVMAFTVDQISNQLNIYGRLACWTELSTTTINTSNEEMTFGIKAFHPSSRIQRLGDSVPRHIITDLVAHGYPTTD